MKIDFFDGEVNSLMQQFVERQTQTIAKCRHLYHPDYLDGFDYLFGKGFSPDDLWQKLATIGWKPQMVDGYLSGYDYFQHLHRKEMPINVHIRPKSEIDFARFPDTVHDIMGHCPMLFSNRYATLMAEISEFICSIKLEKRDHDYLALHQSSLAKREKFIHFIEAVEEDLKKNPTPYYYHTRIGLWTLEFGLIQNSEVTHAYGAAIVASPLEMENIHSGKMPVVQLTPASLETNVNVSDLQDCLYATRNFQEMKEMIFAFPKKVSHAN